jgi:hypothetical protein
MKVLIGLSINADGTVLMPPHRHHHHDNDNKDDMIELGR